MAIDRTEEGRETVEEGRQIVLETLHSKTPSYYAYNSVSTLTSYKQYRITQKPSWNTNVARTCLELGFLIVELFK